MTVTDFEYLKLGNLELNDGVTMEIEESGFSFTPAKKKPQFASNADADGEVLVRESRFTNSSFAMTIRVVRQPTKELALEKLGELTDALQQAEREEGGSPLLWIPANSELEYTAYVLSAEYQEIPISVTGEAGWFINTPIVKVSLTCAPFLETPERQVLAPTESGAEPLQELYVGGIGGDVPAKARLIVEDASEQDRRFAAWGLDVVEDESNPALLFKASTDLTGEGFSGESKTRSGAYGSEKVLRGTSVSQATTICGTGRIEHVGSYGIYLRVYATSAAALFRIAYKNGDGSLMQLEWKEPTVVNGWSEIFMGEITLDEVALGTQTSEVRVEQKAAEGNPANDVNYLILWPTGVAAASGRGINRNTVTALSARDSFEQTEGNLDAPKTLPVGGEWAEVNKTGENGFKVISSVHKAQRAKVSDSAVTNGCYALAGTNKYKGIRVEATFSQTFAEFLLTQRLGVLARYGSAENWVMLAFSGSATWGLFKRVSGTIKEIDAGVFGDGSVGSSIRLGLSLTDNGGWTVYLGNSDAPVHSGWDADFALSGALAEGRIGIYDAWTLASANTRSVDDFSAVSLESVPRVIYSGKQAEFNSQTALRRDSTGTYDGRPSSYRGADFYLQPAGESARINRIAVRARRNDSAAEEDTGVTDKIKTEILVTERFVLPR